MGKGTTFIRHVSCESCGSSDANAVYSDGSATCFSCKKYTSPSDIFNNGSGTIHKSYVAGDEFQVIQTKLSLEEITNLPTDSFRGISKAVAYDAGVKVEYDQERNIIAHYYPITTVGKIRSYKKRVVATKEFKVIGSKIEVPQLFNQVNCGRRKNLVITEGEIDTLSILEMIKGPKTAKFDVVSIVNGAQSARRNVASNLEFVNKYEKIFIAFDNDDQGKEAAKEVAHIIRPGKAHIVDVGHIVMPVNGLKIYPAKDEWRQVKDANDVLYPGGLLNLNENAYLNAIWGAKAYKPDSFVSGEDVWKAFTERSNTKSIPYPLCLNGLNDKLMGMRLGEITLFTSGTGSGKSTVVKEVIMNLLNTQEDKIGLISLEESVGDTATKLIGMQLNKIIRMPDDVTKEEARKAYEAVFANEKIILLDHQGSVQDNSLLQRIEYLCAIGCKYLVLDHITIAVSEGVDGLSGNEAIDKVMSELLKIVKRYNVHLTLISHLRKGSGNGFKSFEEGRMASLDDIKGSGSIKQISFDIVAFSRNMMADDITERNKISFAVLKSRFNGETGKAGSASYDTFTGRLKFCTDTIAFKEA